MKKLHLSRFISMLALSAAVTASALIAAPCVQAAEVGDFDQFETALETDFTQAAQLPLTGWYEKNFEDGRSVKVYFSEETEIRSYFTIVAVPDGVDTFNFVEAQGWTNVADAQGEALFVLEPGEAGWGSPEEEEAYVAEAIGFLSGTRNAHDVPVFSTFGEHYVAGYGKGGAAIERWAAQNPILVIAQAYIDGESAGTEALTAVASTEYDGMSSNGDLTEVLDDTLAQVGIGGRMAPKDVPVPTCLINYTGSEDYWKAANDCTAEAVEGVFHQDIESDAYATWYANQQLKEAGAASGISEVVVAETSLDAAAIYDWMDTWTRYDVTFSYANALNYRLNYQEARVAAQQAAKAAVDSEEKITIGEGIEIWGEANMVIDGHGFIKAGVIAFADDNNDGQKDPREFIAYIPDGYEEASLPLLMIYPGNSQTDTIFMDSTMWWQVAEKEGIVLMFVCETYNQGGVTVSHYDNAGFYQALLDVAKEELNGQYANIDFTRIYGSGQSAGSNITQSFAITNPEFFAAVGSTSGAPFTLDGAVNGTIPVMMITGHTDAGDMGATWDSASLKAWAEYFQSVNGTPVGFAADTATAHTELDSRHPDLYTWANGQGIPMVQWAQCLLRPHNPYPGDMPFLWDWMKHFSFEAAEDGTVTRHYSESAFAEDDAVVIVAPAAEEVTQDKITKIQATIGQNFYGHKVSTIEIAFDPAVTPASLMGTTFTVYDRGSANPDFGEVKIAETQVVGNKVVLKVDQGTEKTEDRARNAFGMMNMAGWYMDSEGNMYCGQEAGEDVLGNPIYPNAAGKTCQGRNLDLILCLNGAPITDGIFSTDTKGNFLEDTVWELPVWASGIENMEVESVNIGWEAPDYDQVTDNGEVPVEVIWPKDYDPNRAEPYPVVNYCAGGGVCYWQVAADPENGILADANNYMCNVLYDTMFVEWAEQFPEAIVMSVNNHSYNTENAALEINSVLDYAIANWNADPEKIMIVGNSQGTIIASDAIRQRPDLYAAFLECNGNFGANIQVTQTNGTAKGSSFCNWTNEEIGRMIDNGVSCWMFNGETDGTNAGVAQDTYEVLAELYRQAGKSEEWIYNHVRVSGLQSWKFKEWGETDHSVTKVVAWNYVANPYADVYENAQPLAPSAGYKFTGAEEGYRYYGYTTDFTYNVYPESVADWAKALFAGEYE